MATLILSTVGTALGGPIGGAIGSLIGQSIDQQLFGPGPRHGPRLGDLAVQTSSYGTAIPRLYGRMRVAGTVVWATDLKESSEAQAGAKGQPDVVTYSYSVSLAVALSSRRVQRIRRIWADGKLLKGEAGDFKVRTGFRFHPGSEDQEVDPLIASIEGIATTPAYRGLALAVFEDLQLAEYGNRIPFLTFETEADDGSVAIGHVLGDASAGAVDCADARSLVGYAAYGRSVRAALQPLVDHFGIELFDDGLVVRSPSQGPALAINEEEIGCSATAERVPRSERAQAPARTLPATLTLSYYDPAREYQTGQMRASIGSSSGVHEAVELPITSEAGDAKALAESSLARRWAQRERLTLRLAPSLLQIEPGLALWPPGETRAWIADRVTIDGLVLVTELRPIWSTAAMLPAEPGRTVPAPDVIAVPTTMALLDLPDLGFSRHDMPVLHLAACSSSSGWRAVPIEVVAGGEIRSAQSAFGEAIIGTVLSAPGPGQAALFDMENSIEVELADGEHWLVSRDDAALAQGANLAALGSELIQFGSAVPLGAGKFRLERLLRGRRGTEWAMGAHAPGEAFVLLSPSSLRAIELARESLGSSVEVRALGIGDGSGTLISAIAGGEAMKPPAPVHLQATNVGGGVHISWVRRSRHGWAWLDGMDAPLGEAAETYRVRLAGVAGAIEFETAVTSADFTSAQLTEVGAGGATLTVTQIGDHALSRPAVLDLTLP